MDETAKTIVKKDQNKLEFTKKHIWLIIAILAGVIVWLLPNPEGLSVEGHRFLSLLVTLIILFLTEALPLPVTMGGVGAMIVLFNIGELQQVWTAYAHPVVFFVIGCLMLANIAEQVGLTRRLGGFLLKHCSNNVVKFSFFSSVVFGIASGFMHDVSAVTLGLMALLPLMRAAEIKPGSNTGKFLVISLAFSCSAGGMSTLVGGGRNMVAVAFLEEFTGIQITFWTWMIHALPPAIIIIPVVWGIVYLVFRPDTSLYFPEQTIEEGMIKEPFNLKEKITLAIVSLVLIGFLTNGFHQVDYSIITILAVVILTAFGFIEWEKLNKEIPWAVAFLIFGGGISMGRAMNYTGTAEFLADVFFPIIAGRSWIILFIGIAILGSLFSEVMANVASAALIIPIALPIAQSAGINPAVIALVLGMFTSFAYFTVIGCPPNAIAYSFGYFSTSDLFKVGIITKIVAIIVLTIITLNWWNILGIII